MTANKKVNKPRGVAPEYVHGRDGKIIHGLSCNGYDGRYYATHSKPRKWFGSDFDHALIKFREWDDRQKGATVTIEEIHDEENRWTFPPTKTGKKFKTTIDIKSDAFWQAVGYAIRSNPQLASEKTGLPLDRLHQFKPASPSPLLTDLGTMYHVKSGASDEWLYKTKRFWDEFVKSVKVDTVRQITQPLVTRYYDEIVKAAKSDTYAKHRFGAVKRVFAFAQQRGECNDKPIDNAELETVLSYCKVFENYKTNGNKEKPNPITVENFHKLLNAADDQWKAILLCALNFCMYAAEICMLEWDDIDLDKLTLVTNRNKPGKVLRVAVIWASTAKALKKLKRTNSPYIFNSMYGTQYDPEGLRTAFRKLRKPKKANVAATVKINNIRDGGIQAAIDAGAEIVQYRLVSGHALGGRDDDYYVRNPRKVAPACEAIEKHYFPPTTKKGGKK